jgi:malate dehydrogenase (oxaloacetate-decarboxylating)(NADP+)
MSTKKEMDALRYHTIGRPGKIEVVPTKPTNTQRDLSLAYSPGVASPCLAIAKNEEDVYKYTAKGNLVAVISNGTAVLGLGDIGPAASKPVMEGKGLLFKIFADIDVFDLEVDAKSIDEFVAVVKALQPTFGGINLEDIRAPESFEIEERLKKELSIPIMHDDQHGTAIISGAALVNALIIKKKDIAKIKMVINGAGAAAIACGKLFIDMGVSKENILMLDSKGVLNTSREGLDKYKGLFAQNTDLQTLTEAMVGADVFVGLSKGDILSPEMLLSMAKDPIVFALANPDPEISYHKACSTRDDLIMATGRSDHPNQVNNVLGFPFIFRGALDVRATEINEKMKMAAVYALAELARSPVPEKVKESYNDANITFGKDYIIPKPIDPRLLTTVAPAVAKAAMNSGVARAPITDWEEYNNYLLKKIGLHNKFLQRMSVKARQNPKRVVFAEADNYKTLMAAQTAMEDGTAIPILLGREDRIRRIMKENQIEMPNVQIIDPRLETETREKYGKILWDKSQRKGVTYYDACKLMRDRNYFGTMMVELGEADAFISGLTKNYPSAVKPALQIIGKSEGVNKVAGMYIMLTKAGPLFFADTTINVDPSWEDLVEIVKLTHRNVKSYQVDPRIAILSYTNFGSVKGATPTKIQKAVSYLHEHHPEIVVDGDMQANFALDVDLRSENFPFNKLEGKRANVLIFPNLESGNIGYKLVQQIRGMEAVGPVLMGFKKSVHVVQLGSSIREIVNMIHVAVVNAQIKENR